jgi:tRNA nucleotidyltransferase (CCA-adding enzyme)
MIKIFNYTLHSLRNTDFIQDIISKNWKPYLVGGCVRDYLMNLSPKDIDIIVVGCDKKELIELLSKYGKPDLVGESFAVIKFNYNGEIYDISTPRTEKKTGDGHKGFEVVSNKNISLETDLFRRDITINSIAMDFDGNFIDPFGGIEDLKNKIVKITNPDAFTDDPLRILRCVRFCARLNFNIDNKTSGLMNEIKPFISELSQERIIEEFNKVFEHAEKDPSILQRYIDLLTEYDMWEQMFPELNINTNIIVDVVSKPIVFFDLLKNENLKLKSKVLNKLTFPTDLVNKIIFLQDYISKSTINNVYKLALLKDRFHIDDDLILDFVNKLKLDLKFAKNFIKYCEDGFVISGDDLKNQGFKLADIGIEKERLEIERFKSDYM